MRFTCRTGFWFGICTTTLLACSETVGPAGGAGGSRAGGSVTSAGAGPGGSTTGSGGASGAGSVATGGASGGGDHAGSGGVGGASGNGGAAIDGGGGAAPVACGAGNVCDGFETYKPGGGFGDWQQNGTSGMLNVDGTHVFGGDQSAHFHVNAGGNQRLQLKRVGAPIFPAKNNAFWGRAMMWAADLPMMSNTENKNVHYDIIQASGTTPGEYRVAGMGGFLLNYEPHDCYFGTQKVIPQNRWACWEWLYDGSKNIIELYVDGVLQARVENKGQGCVDGTSSVWQAPQFNELRVGWVNYQSKGATTDLWIDDFAVGPERIGCPAMPAGAH